MACAEHPDKLIVNFTSLMLALLSAPSGAAYQRLTCQRLELGRPHTAPYKTGDLPLCVQLDALERPGVVLKMSVSPKTAKMCVRIEMLTPPRSLQQETRCFSPEDGGALSIPLLSPGEPHTYIMLPESIGHVEEVPVLTTEVYALKEDGTDPLALSAAGGAASPPRSCPPPTDDRCATEEAHAIAMCSNDTAKLHRLGYCPNIDCPADVISCLRFAWEQEFPVPLSPGQVRCRLATREERGKGRAGSVSAQRAGYISARALAICPHPLPPSCPIPPQCVESMKDTELCYKGVGGLLFPMMVAAYLLLATASVVLLCTMLRCCCRCICSAPLHSHHDDERLSEDEGTDADEEYTVTPLPSGVKQVAKEEEEDENELPAYAEVVEGAAVLPRAPLQTSSS